LVADAVLFACAHRRRQLYVGGGGLLSSIVGQVAPRLTDKVMEAFGRRAQQSPSDPGDPARRDNLYEARADGAERGSQDVRARRTSLTLKAQKRPGTTVALALAFGLLAVSAVKARGRSGNSSSSTND